MSSFDILRNGHVVTIILESGLPEGVCRVANVVADDICLVTGKRPEVVDLRSSAACGSDCKGLSGSIICVRSTVPNDMSGKREIYRFVTGDGKTCCGEMLGTDAQSTEPCCGEALGSDTQVLELFGSDKRGLIYGLFEISEMCGVSPMVWIGDAKPARKTEVVLELEHTFTSKEPSVKYRGFFINDEWPAFGRWCNQHFGGFTTGAYENIFLLLLRLKGNYMWPAMWSSVFSEDGPGLANAEMADMYGVIMGASHHEPMCRAGEEWQHIYSQYGTDNTWNFGLNRDAITAFWRDGILRNKDFENIITIGMRGEADSKLLGENATLEDNINAVKDAILTQRRLLRENICEDLTKVPQMLAIYKEVENFYYGNAETVGLREWDELKDVIFMLCEDNFGNMRGLPEERDLREHRGGFGMYYHFDYHGAPISYEWVNSTKIAKTREQMCMAYEYGIKELWIVNVGDLKGNEYPLEYFMRLAYDYDAWSDDDAADRFAVQFMERNFGDFMNVEQLRSLKSFVDGFTTWNSIRHPEAMNPSIFHPVNYGEADKVEAAVLKVMETGKSLRDSLKTGAWEPFDSMFYYAGMASMNLILMHLDAGRNTYLAAQGDARANLYAESVREKISLDKRYVEAFHNILNRKWDHMMDSAHTGFTRWNDEGWSYPEVVEVDETAGANAGLTNTNADLEGATAGPANPNAESNYAEFEDIIVLQADKMDRSYEASVNGQTAGWRVLKDLGRLGNAIKAYPVNVVFDDSTDLPAAEYDFTVKEAGEYIVRFVMMARNPVVKGDPLRIRYSVNDSRTAKNSCNDNCSCVSELQVINTLGDNFSTEWTCDAWNKGVLSGVRAAESRVTLCAGENVLSVYPYDPNAVLESIIIYPAGKKLKPAYLGPVL